MNAFRAYAMVENNGNVVIGNLPFKPGSLLEVVLIEEVKSDSEIVQEWNNSNERIQKLPRIRELSDKEISDEIQECRKTISLS